jgi:nitroreductase
MEVKKAMTSRRAYRSLKPFKITRKLIDEISNYARLSASCFNNQPWRFLFINDGHILKKMHSTLSKGNEWAKKGSMFIVVFSKKEDDCIIKNRMYYLFDTGMATAFLILCLTDFGLVAHPIAGFSPKKTREILNIPDEYDVITLVIVGKHSVKISKELSDKQIEAEQKRPERFPLNKFVYFNRFE